MTIYTWLGGLEYTADEWNNPHSTIGVHSEGALRPHPHCCIRDGYCKRAQATQNRVSIAPSEYTVWDVEGVNISTVSRGGHSVTSPAGKLSACMTAIYLCIRCRIQNSASHITIKMLLSPFSTITLFSIGWQGIKHADNISKEMEFRADWFWN